MPIALEISIYTLVRQRADEGSDGSDKGERE